MIIYIYMWYKEIHIIFNMIQHCKTCEHANKFQCPFFSPHFPTCGIPGCGWTQWCFFGVARHSSAMFECLWNASIFPSFSTCFWHGFSLCLTDWRRCFEAKWALLGFQGQLLRGVTKNDFKMLCLGNDQKEGIATRILWGWLGHLCLECALMFFFLCRSRHLRRLVDTGVGVIDPHSTDGFWMGKFGGSPCFTPIIQNLGGSSKFPLKLKAMGDWMGYIEGTI